MKSLCHQIGLILTFAGSRQFLISPSVSFGKKISNFTQPETIADDEWKKLLWVSMDLKKTVQNSNKECLSLLRGKHVTLLFEKPHGRFQLAFTLACSILGARKTSFFATGFKTEPNPSDLGRALSQLTDMFIVNGIHQDALINFQSSTTIPLFPASCNVHSLQKVLSDLMTLQERFNKLEGLTLAWIGPPTPVLNSYLLLCPFFGIEVRYLCICIYGSGKMSPVKQLKGKSCQTLNGGTQEYKTVKEIVADSNVIATSMHPEEKSQITLELLKQADKDWVLLHTLPRTSPEVTDEVFYHENNLSWTSSGNCLYVAMAIILTSLKNYTPTTEKPNFRNSETRT